jgi:hypothetical protein
MSLRDPRATPASHVRASAMFILVVRHIDNLKARRWGVLRWCNNRTNVLVQSVNLIYC